MEKEEAKGRPGTTPDGMGGLLGSVTSDVQPIEREGNNESADCFRVAGG